VGHPGRGQDAADEFRAALEPQRCAQIEAISLDMGADYARSARTDGNAPQAIICIDSYHVLTLATRALDEVRRDYWNQLRAVGDQQAAKRFKDARWGPAEEPREPHCQSGRHPPQAQTRRRRGVARLHAQGSPQGQLRPGLALDDVVVLLERFISRATVRAKPTGRAGRTVTRHLSQAGSVRRRSARPLRPPRKQRRINVRDAVSC
jgi:hypothetical protein